MFSEVYEEVLEIVSYMTFYSPKISMDMWTLWPLMMEALSDWAIDFFPSKLYYNANPSILLFLGILLFSISNRCSDFFVDLVGSAR